MINAQELKSISSQVRRDILRMVASVSSGHPGGSLGCADFFLFLGGFCFNLRPGLFIERINISNNNIQFSGNQILHREPGRNYVHERELFPDMANLNRQVRDQVGWNRLQNLLVTNWKLNDRSSSDSANLLYKIMEHYLMQGDSDKVYTILEFLRKKHRNRIDNLHRELRMTSGN